MQRPHPVHYTVHQPSFFSTGFSILVPTPPPPAPFPVYVPLRNAIPPLWLHPRPFPPYHCAPCPFPISPSVFPQHQQQERQQQQQPSQQKEKKNEKTETSIKTTPGAHSLPLPSFCVEKELDAVEGVLLNIVEEIRKRRRVLAAVKARTQAQAHQQSQKDNRASPSRTAATKTSADPLSHWREVSAIRGLLIEAEGMAAQMRKKIAAAFDQMTGCNFAMDLSGLLKRRVGAASVIRSFQAVTPVMLHGALKAFTEKGERENLYLFLTVGADLDGLVGGKTALMKAVNAENSEAVEMLLQAGAGLEVKSKGDRLGDRVIVGDGLTALHFACHQGLGVIVGMLLSQGANANAESVRGDRPLHVAVRKGFVEFFVPLLSHGAKLHARNTAGNTALDLAALLGQREAATKLLDLGAAVNDRDDKGMSTLHRTAAALLAAPTPGGRRVTDHKDVAALELLISHGANVNARCDDGHTVLGLAVRWGSADVAELLLDAGADLHATDNEGRTGLHLAALRTRQMNEVGVDHQKKLRIAQILVSRGINVHALTNDGMTALALAERDLPQDSPIRTFLAGLPPQPPPQEHQQ
uniref:Uncharacterized protein n=1 Tax=Chromera velia CCMP2878 TaxID=1169474 RepID=A0A0G4GRR6_9ALVE|eukprot:Cvel_23102.t1-p1 / transcript=Cvel_23102.t1 / gene=Cvel_23102 / organism=Chromera_velia_CCMP2878 / gene_product=Ankyrin-3, putative / transcript_product=Ankyrin-3, putative / location=Cvel_scaffold2344:11647-13389(+) / protein_length=581 / sequence_SO=supercontig / SO=protein_coding / is_pseudo=false